MELLKYKKLDDYEVRKILNKYLDLTDYQKDKLLEINRFPFEIIKYEKPQKVNPLWRLTVFFYLLFLICISLSIPIKWLLTGNRFYSDKTLSYKILVKWHKKLGFKN